MQSKEQQAANAESKIHGLKVDCLGALRAFHDSKARRDPSAMQAQLLMEWVKRFDALSNSVESCVATSDLLGANRSELWAKELANTAANLLDTVPAFYEKLWHEAKRLEQPRQTPSLNAFSAMQSAVAAYNPDQISELKVRFDELGLPVRGFTHGAIMNTLYNRGEKIGMVVTVVLFVLLLLGVAVLKKDYPPEAFFIIRVILALFAAAFAAMSIPGFLKVKLKLSKSIAVKATGAIAVFVLIYLLNPPTLMTKDEAEEKPAGSSLPAESGEQAAGV